MLASVSVTLLVIVIFVLRANDDSDEAVMEVNPTATLTATPASEGWKPLNGDIQIEANETYGLWKSDELTVYVKGSHLYYDSHNKPQQTLYDWKKGVPSQVWTNGKYLLIGTQLVEKGSKEEGHHGHWIAFQMKPAPEVIFEDQSFFGPQEMLSVTLSEDPSLFVVKVRNGESASEHVFDPLHGEWTRIYRESSMPHTQDATTSQAELRYYSEVRKIQLEEGPAVYHLTDDHGGIYYFQEPYYFVMAGDKEYDLTEAKLIEFVESTPQIMGRFRKPDGEEAQAFLNNCFTPVPVESKLWDGEWFALNEYSFAGVRPDRVDVVRYKEGYSLTDNEPVTASYPTEGRSLAGVEGSLVEYKSNGQSEYISLFDAVNAEADGADSLWLSPWEHYTVKNENRPDYVAETESHTVPEWRAEEHNTNAPIPEELLRAVDEVYPPSDYSQSATYRYFGEQWFVLIDQILYEYKEGALIRIGQLPVKISVTTGEAFSGRGVQDFIRAEDEWFVADTEGNRVLKLNGKLEVTAEIGAVNPYKLTMDGERLQISVTAAQMTVDINLKLIETVQQPFESTSTMKKAVYEYFWPQQWHKDEDSGLTWYYIDRRLYQYDEKKQQYRKFYVGESENYRTQPKIIPYRNEMILLLDRRLERFDRQGNWLSTLTFPRSQPDGIYDRTGQGEGDLIIDENTDVMYLVQGYRILAIDIKQSAVHMVFRQNYADIGKLFRKDNDIYFMMHSNQNDIYTQQVEGEAAREKMHTEIVKLNMQSRITNRYLLRGYYDSFAIDSGSGDPYHFVLRSYY